MNLDNYIKTVLSGVKTWAQSTFAKKSDIKDMYYDHRTFVTTKEVSVNGTVGEGHFIKVADTLDFDIDTVISVSRYGNDGVDYANQPVVIYKDYGVDVIVTTDDFCLGVYFESQTEIDDWGGPTSWTPGLYMYTFLDEGDLCSIAYSFTYANGELRKIDPKYIDIPLATVTEPGAVHPWINNEYGQDVWMNPENGELYTYNNSYTLPVATANTLGGVKPVTKTSKMTQEVGIDGDGRLYAAGVGRPTADKTYQIDGQSVVALYGAEIFNDYSNNKAIGRYSHAEGSGTIASGDGGSHAEGSSTKATGGCSHAEGTGTVASGLYTHAEGFCTIASGSSSHAEGCSVSGSIRLTGDASSVTYKVYGGDAHLVRVNGEIGYQGVTATVIAYDTKTLMITLDTTLSDNESLSNDIVSLSFRNIASGNNSHVEGHHAVASGENSHAEGYGTTAYGNHQHVQGAYNIEDGNSIYAHIVGNGLGVGEKSRSNAHTLDWNGNAWFAGDIYVGSTSGTNKDDGSQKLVTMADVEASIDESIQEALADFEVGNATISWDSF